MAKQQDTVETTLLNGRVRCLQPEIGYRIAIDTVLMAAAVPARAGDRVLDVGSGAGAAGFCVAARVNRVQVTGIEIQPEFSELARRNADLNGMADQFQIVDGDIALAPDTVKPDGYDHVLSNPPFVEAGRGQVPPEVSKARATMESSVTLGEWIAFCIRMARTKATVTIVHRADRVEEILAAMSGRVGELVIFPLWPGGDKPRRPAKRVIVQGRKGMKGPTTLACGLVLHQPGGAYTDETNRILLDAEALEIR
jgi:tRNA1(Val) A37 N6-methylase TrmN6